MALVLRERELDGSAERDDHDQRTPEQRLSVTVVNEPLAARIGLIAKRDELWREIKAMENKIEGLNRAIELLSK